MTLCDLSFNVDQDILGLNIEQNILNIGVGQSVLDFNVECVIDQSRGDEGFLLQEDGNYILQEDSSKIKV